MAKLKSILKQNPGSVPGPSKGKVSKAGRVVKKEKRLATASKLKLDKNLQIVPWASRDEWSQVCAYIHQKNYKTAVSEILIWQNRVPFLPIAAETTLLVLEAKCYDDLKFSPESNYNESHARSLYGVALVRHLNHVGQVAATSLGEKTSMPSKDLASHVGTPDWLVSLRNDVNHGSKIPSTEALRISGEFIIEWLKERYWKHPEYSPHSPEDDIFSTSTSSTDVDTGSISKMLSAFIAARIYRFREVQLINDYEITQYLKDKPRKAKTKSVLVELKSRIVDLLHNNCDIMCSVIAQEMVPSNDFYLDFKRSFTDTEPKSKQVHVHSEAFQQLLLIWTPVVKLLEKNKSKLLFVCLRLGEIHSSSETDEDAQDLSARWILKMLEILEQSGKTYTNKLLILLKQVMLAPNTFSKLFLFKLTRLLEIDLGEETVEKLGKLASIWIEGSDSSEKSSAATASMDENYFTMDDIIQATPKPSLSSPSLLSNSNWTLDSRGSEFWSKLPVGSVL